ncbi:MAG: pitrilysin family protein, partial [Oscillospiraceae bacterium]|nr:pitrilysin family protein [Oscillospiraceae bacterium]
MNKIHYPRLQETFFEQKLPNGLTVRVVPKPGFARKYAFYATNYGAIDTSFSVGDQHYRTPDGVAHYLEHKMFDLPEGNAMQMFSKTGASPNAFTGYSMTAYYFDCTEQFDDNLRLLLKMVSTGYFTAQSVEKERGIIGQEIRMYEDSPTSRVYENLFSTMFANHPVRVPIAGTVQSIAEITAETLQLCHDTFYHPSNMMLCVVGDVEPDAVLEIAEQALPRTQAEPIRRDYGAQERLDVPTHLVRGQMAVSMPMFSLGFKCGVPPKGPEVLRLELMGDLASELLMGEASPLYVRLYEKGLIDTGFSSGYEGLKGACLFCAGGDSSDPAAVRDAILDEAQRLARTGLDERRFERLKKAMIGRRLTDLDSFEAICCRMTESWFEGVEYYTFPELYETITL